jgi:hypothetical protein
MFFPELWKRAHLIDCRKPKNKDGERPPKEVLNFEFKKIKEDREKQEDCAPCSRDAPLDGVHVQKCQSRNHASTNFSLWLQRLCEGISVSISLSSLDQGGNTATFTGAVEPILPVPDPLDNDEPKEKKEQQRELLKKMAAEESLLNHDLYMSHLTDTPLTKAEIGNLFSEASKSSIWKESETLKEYKWPSALAEKDVLFKDECKNLQKQYEIEFWWFQ